MSALKIQTFPTGSLACNCSIIYSEESKESVIVDPGNDLTTIKNEVERLGINVKKLLHTHAHFDHIGCSKELAKDLGASIHLHKKDELLYKALPAQAMMFGLPPMTAGKVDSYLEDGEEFSLEDSNIRDFLKTIFTPGHTEGSCSFYSENLDGPVLFAGDTLFRQGIGRTDLPGGDFEAIKKSIKDRLYNLPDETQVITGHGPSTRIFEEKRQNPFVSG